MIGDNIKRLRLGKGYSQEQLARKLDISQGAVSQWEKGKTIPDTPLLLQLAQIFGVSLNAFTDDSPQRDLDGVVAMRNMAVPIIGDIACGTPITAQENVEGYAQLPEGIHADFALKCRGDSMKPTFNDGDLVLIRKQPEVEDGQIAAVMIDNEATLKRFYRQEDGILLVADNPKFPPLTIKNENISEMIVCGLAVGYVRIF